MTTPPASISIPKIQGPGAQSPLLGKLVNTEGVVTAITPGGKQPGFFLQAPKTSARSTGSSGIFIQAETGTKLLDKLQPGSSVRVRGTVAELGNLTSIVVDASGVEILRRSPVRLTKKERDAGVTSKDGQLPEPVPLKIPATAARRASYLEGLEGMRVSLPNAMALGPSDKYDSWWAVDAEAAGAARPADSKTDPRRIEVSAKFGPGTPIVVGDRPERVEGILTETDRGYALLQIPNYGTIKRSPYPPQAWGDMDGDGTVTSGDVAMLGRRVGQPAASPLDAADLDGNGVIAKQDVEIAAQRAEQGARATGAPTFRVSSVNVRNLFDLVDDPKDDDRPSANALETQMTRLAGVIKDRLHAPEVIALQEVENAAILEQLAARPELAALDYKVALLPGNDRRGINVGLMYRGDLVSVDQLTQLNTPMPQKLRDTAPSKLHTHTTELFARPPLVADLTVQSKDGSAKEQLTIIANHLISKFSPSGAPTDPIRIAQGKFLHDTVKQLREASPDREVIVIGDMNDRHDSKAVKAIRGSAKAPLLTNAVHDHVPPAERYSYVFQGAPELIDHVLVTGGLAPRVARAGVAHLNADVPFSHSWGTAPLGDSDHDHPYVDFLFGGTAEAAAAAQAVSKPKSTG